MNCEGSGDDCFQPEKNPALKREIKLARRSHVADNLIKRVIQFAKQGYTRHRFPDLRHRLGLGGLSHGLGAELEQFGARHRRVPQGRRSRRRLGPDLAHQARQGRQDREGARPVGEDRPTPPGPAPIPACSSTPPSTTGTPARRRGRSALQSVLGIHVPRRHGVQSRVAQPAHLPRREDRRVRRRGLRAHHPAVDRRARNLGADGAVPEQADRAALLRVPHARPRLRQYRRPADVVGHPVRLAMPAARSAARSPRS